jgi:hypothetical protein
MKHFVEWVRRRIVQIITVGVLLTSVFALYLYKQNSLIPGANSYEQSVVQSIDNYEYPWRNPVNAPYITASYIVHQSSFLSSLQSARFVSAVASVMSVFMFYQLLRNWLLSPGKAVIGTALFATSSWMLTIGRGAHASTLGIFLMLLVFTLGTRLLFTTKPLLDWLTLVTATLLAIYTPMVIWLLFVAGVVSIIHYRQRQRSLPLKTWHKYVVVTVSLVLVLPMLLALIRTPSLYLDILAIRLHVDSPISLLLNFSDIIRTIFFTSIKPSALNLGNLPLLDIFGLFMFMIGVYYFERRLSLKRSKMLFGGLFMGILICSLSPLDMANIALLAPLVYVFIAAGVHETITRWLNVFPRNPLARSTGIIAIAVAVGFTSSYHLTKVFVARPGNPEIRSMYEQK